MKPSLPRIRLMIVDDHFFVRMGLAASVRPEPDIEVVAEASGVEEAVRIYSLAKPDVVLLDCHLSDGEGIEVLRQILSSREDAHIVMLSVDDSEESVFRAMDSGAASYLSKSAPLEELLLAIREAYHGRTYLPGTILETLNRRTARPELSEREMQVLNLVAHGQPNKIIAAELGIAEMTVKIHLTRIFGKLGVQDRTSATTTALRTGLVRLE